MNGPAVHPSTFPDETGAMMWVDDGLGKRRISQKDGGTGRHHWRWDAGWNPIAEYEDANATWWPTTKVKANYPGLAEQVTSTGAYRYYTTDLLGSVRRMRNDAKASLATYEYEPYGGAYYNSGIALNVGFTGHQWDPNMGLYYAPFRWYNPGAARWLTRDPLGYVDGPNVYAYVWANPASYVDLYGLTLKDWCVDRIKDGLTKIKKIGPLIDGWFKKEDVTEKPETKEADKAIKEGSKKNTDKMDQDEYIEYMEKKRGKAAVKAGAEGLKNLGPKVTEPVAPWWTSFLKPEKSKPEDPESEDPGGCEPQE